MALDERLLLLMKTIMSKFTVADAVMFLQVT